MRYLQARYVSLLPLEAVISLPVAENYLLLHLVVVVSTVIALTLVIIMIIVIVIAIIWWPFSFAFHFILKILVVEEPLSPFAVRHPDPRAIHTRPHGELLLLELFKLRSNLAFVLRQRLLAWFTWPAERGRRGGCRSLVTFRVGRDDRSHGTALGVGQVGFGVCGIVV